jgi:hypothetical protein
MKKKELIIDRSILAQVRTGLDLIRSILMSGKGSIRIEIMEHRPRRTDRQNRYYWPCFVQPLAEFLREQGDLTEDEEAHELIKAKFLRKTIVNKKTGEVMEYVGSTTDLTTKEFNEYLNRVAFWLADMFGIVVPDPNVYHEREDKDAA